MEITQFVVDAFTDEVFKGNPAAVCILEDWIPEDLMKNIAFENGFSETAFIVKEKEGYRLRWFTPKVEIGLCGHATLATAYVMLSQMKQGDDSIRFETLSGVLCVKWERDIFFMDLPSFSLRQVEVSRQIIEALGVRPVRAFLGRDLVCELESEKQVCDVVPDMQKVEQLDGLLLHVTAQGGRFDCVSRSFAPKCGVVEDPVCGSGHCHIVPYWSDRLGKKDFVAYQASPRGGILYCSQKEGRTTIGGKCALYAEATLHV